MNPLRYPLFAFFLAALCGAAEPAAKTAAVVSAPPPVEAFFNWPEIAAPSVAPDGMKVAFLAPVADRMSVVVFDLRTAKVMPVARAYDGDITEFFWKDGDHIVFSSDPNGRESRAYFVIDLKANHVTVLAENLRENRQQAAFASLVDPLRFDPAHILVYGRSSAGGWHAGLYRINLVTAERMQAFGADPQTDEWHPDCAGSVRYRARHHEGRTFLEVRADDQSDWKPLEGQKDGYRSVYDAIEFRGFAANNRTVYLTREHPDGHVALYGYDTTADTWGEPIFRSDERIVGVRLSPSHDRVEAVRYGIEGRSEQWLDARLGQLWGRLRASFPAQDDVAIGNSDDHENVFVVRVSSDVNPGTYYLLDLRGKTQLVELGKARPQLKPGQLRPMKAVTYTARDGLVIHAYLTLPAGAEGHRVPLILNPHGGPYGIRDEWGFNAEVQFLASRGYAVLQPNYRGSGGYGEKFFMAGQHQWGRRMQDDLTDAVKWAIDQGIADPKRVCIYGASYGGYAALAGAVFTPDLYRCAVNYVGVSDLSLISNWQNEQTEAGETYFKHMVGDDKAFIDAYSPVNFVERIKVPTLHAYGENDPRVKIKNWTELERQLKKYHKPYEYVREGNQGHGFMDEKARINFYRTLETFLAKNMPVTAEPPVASNR